MTKSYLGVGKKLWIPTRPTNPTDPPARELYMDGYWILLFFLFGFRAGHGFCVFCRVYTYLPDHLIINIKKKI